LNKNRYGNEITWANLNGRAQPPSNGKSLDYSFLRYVNSTMINLVQSLYQMGIQGNANK